MTRRTENNVFGHYRINKDSFKKPIRITHFEARIVQETEENLNSFKKSNKPTVLNTFESAESFPLRRNLPYSSNKNESANLKFLSS